MGTEEGARQFRRNLDNTANKEGMYVTVQDPMEDDGNESTIQKFSRTGVSSAGHSWVVTRKFWRCVVRNLKIDTDLCPE
ncbi:hypothetical protein DNTS_027300 [Danionella cerebrum]|uniref:Uncharacterized protein n=1 Tax=Danionella cerebrum TaxID=2873325 RepID=A0A553QVT1_9TELE|nr:hypothetical protein DNTS_027300 [Danionella translucida]TRY94060.1 hypothetical protein DNTS_027300 [Danionella translucida]TRY94061.1 hypothetical protein DNTS_027300 [Danionella translucida]